MELDPGELQERVSLYANAPTDTGDHLGTAIRTQWCKIEPAGGRAVEIGAVTGSFETHKVTFRHLPTVQQGWWMKDQQGQQYEIVRVSVFRRDRQEAWARLNHPAGIVSP